MNFTHRNRFSNGIILKRLSNSNQKLSVGLVKFIGRQHSCLTSITDQLNSCYSFQVLLLHLNTTFFLHHLRISEVTSKMPFSFFLDNDHHWNYFWNDHFLTLLFISIHSASKWILQWAIFGAHGMGNTLSDHHFCDHLHCESTSEWGSTHFHFRKIYSSFTLIFYRENVPLELLMTLWIIVQITMWLFQYGIFTFIRFISTTLWIFWTIVQFLVILFQKLAQLSQQIQHTYPIVSCALFSFDWNLLFTVG